MRDLRKRAAIQITLIIIAAAALATGCTTTSPDRWPVQQMLDPVTEEPPNVITP